MSPAATLATSSLSFLILQEMPGNHVGAGGTNPHSQTSLARLHYWGLRGVTQGWENWSGGLRRALPLGQGGIGESARGAVDTTPPTPHKITTLPQAPLTSRPTKVPNLGQDSLEPPVPPSQLHQMEHGGGGIKDNGGMPSLNPLQKDFAKSVDGGKGYCGTNIYLCASVSVCACVCVCMCNICGPLLSPCLPGCMLFCLLSSVLKLPKRGLVLHRPLCHCWLISPLESWGAVHLGGGGKEPSCLKVISCDCKGWGRGSLGGQGASWGLVSPYTAPQMPLLPETQAQANKRFSVSFWWWLSFEV